MAAKVPTESAWKSLLGKHKLKDNGLQRALATFEKLGDDKPADKIKALDTAKKLAGTLAKDKAVAGNADATKFLDAVDAAVEPAKKELAAASKAAAKQGAGSVDWAKHEALLTKGETAARSAVATMLKGPSAEACEKLRQTVKRMQAEMDAAVRAGRQAARARDVGAAREQTRRWVEAFSELNEALSALAECSQKNGVPQSSTATALAVLTKLRGEALAAEKMLSKAS